MTTQLKWSASIYYPYHTPQSAKREAQATFDDPIKVRAMTSVMLSRDMDLGQDRGKGNKVARRLADVWEASPFCWDGKLTQTVKDMLNQGYELTQTVKDMLNQGYELAQTVKDMLNQGYELAQADRAKGRAACKC